MDGLFYGYHQTLSRAGQLWETWRPALSASEPGSRGAGVHPDQPARSHRCLSVKVLGPELRNREGAREQAALRDPTQAAHVRRPCRRAHPTPAGSGGRYSSASLARGSPLRSHFRPCPRRALTHQHWLRGKFGGAAAAAARRLGAWLQRRLRGRGGSRLKRRGAGGGAAPEGGSGEGRRERGGDPGPISLQRPRFLLSAPRAAPTPGMGARGAPWARTPSATARPGVGAASSKHPSLGLCALECTLGLEKEVEEGSDLGEN